MAQQINYNLVDDKDKINIIIVYVYLIMVQNVFIVNFTW